METPKQTNQAELPKVKKFVDNLVAEEEIKIERALEDEANKRDSRMVEFLGNKKALLENNPIEYFTREKRKFQTQLEAIENNKKYTKKQKEDEGDLVKFKIRQIQRAIIGLEELSGKKRRAIPKIVNLETRRKEKEKKNSNYYVKLITRAAAALALMISHEKGIQNHTEKTTETETVAVSEAKDVTKDGTNSELEEIREIEDKKFRKDWAQIKEKKSKETEPGMNPIQKIKQRIYAQINTPPEKLAPEPTPVGFAPIIVENPTENKTPPTIEIPLESEFETLATPESILENETPPKPEPVTRTPEPTLAEFATSVEMGKNKSWWKRLFSKN
jgi:hypothetical protein